MELKFISSFVDAITGKGKQLNPNTNRYKRPVYRYKKRKKTRLVNYLRWGYTEVDWMQVDADTRLERCVVIQKDGCLQMTYAFRGHDIESFSEDYVAMVFEYFNSQIKRLGDGWMVSVEAQRFKMHDYPASDFDCVAALLVDKERQADFRDSGDHYDSCYFLTFVYKPELEIKRKFAKFFFKEGEHTILIEDEIRSFRKKVEQIASVLSARLIIRPLSEKETIEYLHSTYSCKRQEIRIPQVPGYFIDTLFNDESIEIGKTCVQGDYYIPILEINDFPDRTYPAILNDFNKLDIEYRWVARFFTLGSNLVNKELESYQQSASASKTSSAKLLSNKIAGTTPTLQNYSGVAKQNDVEEAMMEFGAGINGFGYYNSCVMVWDTDYDKAHLKLRDVQACVEKHGFTCKEEEFGAFDAYLGMTCGNVTADVRRPMVSTGNYTHCLPFSAIWAGIEHNKFLGEITGCDKPLAVCATNYGSNFYFNLNEGDVGHTLILGPTGAGKSTLLNLIVASALKYPDAQVFFLDYGLSTLTLTLAVGGSFVDPGAGGVCFQPLRDVDNEEEFVWAVDYMRTIAKMQLGDPARYLPEMDVAIESAVRALTIMPVEMRTITTFVLNLDYVDPEGRRPLDNAFAPYRLEGRFGEIFDGNKTTLQKSRWVLFEMQRLMDMGPMCSAPAILFIFHYLEKNFTGRLTFFVMDECWFGLENEVIREKMKQYLLILRKKNVFCIFATQNPSAVARSPLATTMIQNCPTQVFLADPKAQKLAEDYHMLGLEDEEIAILASARKKRDYYYKSSLGTRLFQLGLGPLQLALFRGYETKLSLPDGRVVPWKNVLSVLLEDRKSAGYDRAYPDKILDAQQVEFRSYVEGEDWESYL